MSCDRFAQVHAYHDGELTASQEVAVEAHVRSCDPCAALLDELRSLSQLLAEVPLPEEANVAPSSRYYGAFHQAQGQQQRGILRLSGWLTTAAAAVIAVTLLRSAPPVDAPAPIVSASAAIAPLPIWQYSAVMPAREQEGEGANGELVVVAQWLADDLAVDDEP